MTASRIVDRARTTATGAWQIRSQGDVYQVCQAPYRATTTPAYTTRDLASARAWIASQGTPARVGRPPRADGEATRLEIRLTEPERVRWQSAADRESLSMSGLVRASVELAIARGGTR